MIISRVLINTEHDLKRARRLDEALGFCSCRQQEIGELEVLVQCLQFALVLLNGAGSNESR